MTWTSGPCFPSLEAPYAFCSPEGPLRYHHAPNALMTMSAVNMMRGSNPIVVMPLGTVILNAGAIAGSLKPESMSAITWAYNALCNAACIHKAFHTIDNNKMSRFTKWSSWSKLQQTAVLDAQRTLTLTALSEDLLLKVEEKDLFRVVKGSIQPLSAAEKTQWDRKHLTMERIAAKYDINPAEFELYFTIASRRQNKRVFYPFHQLSIPQAEAIGWDWCHTVAFSVDRLERMRRECNRHAEEAGLGERKMDPEKFVFWQAHHFCKVARDVKRAMPDASPENVRFLIFCDRWGLPIVPWIGHTLCASLCKGPDHGIAMTFGLVEPSGLESFDPVRHFDLELCTVTIDSVTTNEAMWNYASHSWSRIRGILASVPCSHPLWRFDASAGNIIWRAPSSTTVAPEMPVSSFSVPALTSLEPWSSGKALDPRCDSCEESFQSLGSLVHHCRTTHSLAAADSPSETAALDSVQQALDAKYWAESLTCPVAGCDASFTNVYTLKRHILVHGEASHRCDWMGCDYTTTDPENLRKHRRTHIPDERYTCDWPGCKHVATSAALLQAHKTTHTGDKPWKCQWPECDKAYAHQSALLQHEQSHVGKKHVCPVCGKELTQAGNLRRHIKRKHPGDDS